MFKRSKILILILAVFILGGAFCPPINIEDKKLSLRRTKNVSIDGFIIQQKLDELIMDIKILSDITGVSEKNVLNVLNEVAGFENYEMSLKSFNSFISVLKDRNLIPDDRDIPIYRYFDMKRSYNLKQQDIDYLSLEQISRSDKTVFIQAVSDLEIYNTHTAQMLNFVTSNAINALSNEFGADRVMSHTKVLIGFLNRYPVWGDRVHIAEMLYPAIFRNIPDEGIDQALDEVMGFLAEIRGYVSTEQTASTIGRMLDEGISWTDISNAMGSMKLALDIWKKSGLEYFPSGHFIILLRQLAELSMLAIDSEPAVESIADRVVDIGTKTNLHMIDNFLKFSEDLLAGLSDINWEDYGVREKALREFWQDLSKA